MFVYAYSSLRWLICCLAISWLAASGAAVGQTKGGASPFGDFGMPPPAMGGFGQDSTFEASFELTSDGKSGRLSVKAAIADGWHIYSTTQPDGGPLKTRIASLSEQIKLSGPFIADHAPDIRLLDVWPDVPIEEHHGAIIWSAPFKVVGAVDSQTDSLPVVLEGQICTDAGACVPISEKLSAKFSGTVREELRSESLRVDDTQAVWSASIAPSRVKPGQSAVLSLTAKTDSGYHVYPFLREESDYRTIIAAQTKSGLTFGEPKTNATIELDNRLDEPIAYHIGPVTWQIPIRVPNSAADGEYPVELLVAFMTCNDRSCSPRSGLSVAGNVIVDSQATGNEPRSVLGFVQVDYKDVLDRPSLVDWIDDASDKQPAVERPSRWAGGGLELWMVFAALGGGFILNFMPCVLPVIGLKLMSFVNQSGSNQARVITLNLAYVGGILAVMLVLALVTVLAKLAWGSAFGWGEQFTVLEFKVVLAALVFAMALSFLGVWEIPIPGFAMSSTSGDLMEKEGPWGAFLKGILTTVLATPCSGPLLGSLFGLSLTLAPHNVILLYLIVGFGMSLPYLALCLNPSFIKLLPKPGAWMETLKQALAFPLLLTVVFFIASIDADHRIATLILLIVVWFACWLIGRVPAYAEKRRLRAAWLTGAATIALGSLVSFTFFGPLKSDLPWVPYNEMQLAQLRQEGKTVMIDFTANWCINCQINTRVAIDKKRVAELVAKNNVVPMLADWTGRSEEIREKLVDLNSNSIPLLAIYPPDPTAEPILLRDLLTESQVVEALEKAGPSRSKAKLTSAIE